MPFPGATVSQNRIKKAEEKLRKGAEELTDLKACKKRLLDKINDSLRTDLIDNLKRIRDELRSENCSVAFSDSPPAYTPY